MPIRFKQYKNKELARQRRNEQRKKYYDKTAYASKHKREWTKVEDEYVLAHTMTDFELAQMLKRSVKAIQLRRCRLKKGKPMTTDLEKQFFDTFGIEPTPIYSELWADEWVKDEYPQISDRILLGLICIWNLYCIDTLIPTDYKNVKKYVLRHFVHIDTYKLIVDAPIVKRQVRTLFEEG